MAALLEESLPSEYKARTDLLLRHSIAVWDVAGSCHRKGSLDKNIRNVKLNDFSALFAEFPQIRHVFCNGTAAYSLFKRKFHLPEGMELTRLPSTSPAHAVSFYKKLEAWRKVAEVLK